MINQAYPTKKLVVLVVEDESLVLLTALNIVEEAGFEAIGAANADQAIRILESRTDIRAVFTDVQMPGSIDGLKLARLVRDRWPPVALIVTSGLVKVSKEDLPGGVHFVGKPYQPAEIGTALRQLTAG
jgi:CheY-like chemotaxis protein